jgi:hypothetical protein
MTKDSDVTGSLEMYNLKLSPSLGIITIFILSVDGSKMVHCLFTNKCKS